MIVAIATTDSLVGGGQRYLCAGDSALCDNIVGASARTPLESDSDVELAFILEPRRNQTTNAGRMRRRTVRHDLHALVSQLFLRV